jgi:hypothetical protein
VTPASPLERLVQASGHELPTLIRVRETTMQRLEQRRKLFDSCGRDEDVAIVLLGSWGRCEVTSGSDDDYMVLVHGEPRTEVRPSVDEVRSWFEDDPGGTRAPGRENIFGELVFSQDLIDNVGLDRDTNSNLTRRSLLMLESVALAGGNAHEAARQAVVDSYLSDTIKDFRPPRFLLNDLVRYWRTIGVDFVAKDRTRHGQGWGLRNAKLRTSRKLLFASGLLPVLTCHEHRTETMLPFLLEQFRLPPVDRLAEAFLRYHSVDHGVQTLVAYDQFLQLIDDPDVRAELNCIAGGRSAAASASFDTVARLGTAIDAGLLGLLFGPALARWTTDFAIL